MTINEEDFHLPELVQEILDSPPPINTHLEIDTNIEMLENGWKNITSLSSLNPYENGFLHCDAPPPTKTLPEVDTNIEILAKKLQNLINPSVANSNENGFWHGGFATSEWVHPQNSLLQSNRDNKKTSRNMTFLEKTGGTGVFLPLSASSSSTKEAKYQFGRNGVSFSNQNYKKYTKCVGDNRKASFKGASKEIEGNKIELTLGLKKI